MAGGGNYGLVGDFPDEMRALTNLEGFAFSKMLHCFSHNIVVSLQLTLRYRLFLILSVQQKPERDDSIFSHSIDKIDHFEFRCVYHFDLSILKRGCTF